MRKILLLLLVFSPVCFADHNSDQLNDNPDRPNVNVEININNPDRYPDSRYWNDYYYSDPVNTNDDNAYYYDYEDYQMHHHDPR